MFKKTKIIIILEDITSTIQDPDTFEDEVVQAGFTFKYSDEGFNGRGVSTGFDNGMSKEQFSSFHLHGGPCQRKSST